MFSHNGSCWAQYPNFKKASDKLDSMSVPQRRTTPESGLSSAMMILIAVVLPAPTLHNFFSYLLNKLIAKPPCFYVTIMSK